MPTETVSENPYAYTEDVLGSKVALDPSPRQRRLLDEFDRAARFAFNWIMGVIKREIAVAWESVHGFKRFWNFIALRNLFNQWKPTIYHDYKLVSKEAFASGVKDAVQAFDNWYSSLIGRRKGRRVGFPRFRCRGGRTHSFTITTGCFGLIDPEKKEDPKAIRIPKIGRVHAFENVKKRVGDGEVTSMTVFREGNRWYASLTIHNKTCIKKKHKKKRPCTGLDLGCADLVVSSDGTVIHAPKFAKQDEEKVNKLRNKLSRKKGAKKGEKPSKGYIRCREQLTKATQRIKNRRNDALAKMADAFCRTYSHLFLEDLKSQNMSRKRGVHKRGLNRSIMDASFAMFRDCIFRSAKKYDTKVTVINKFYPSTKTCHCCGHKQKVALSDRVYVCENCGFVCNRDLNAALNIRDEGIKTYIAESASVGDNEEKPSSAFLITTKQLELLSMRLGAAVGNDGLIDRINVADVPNAIIEDTS